MIKRAIEERIEKILEREGNNPKYKGIKGQRLLWERACKELEKERIKNGIKKV